MTRTLTPTVRVPPRRSIVRFCRTRSSFTCIDSGTSSMSSRKIVPPSASSKRPGRSLIAPVNAPRSWPNSSDSISVSENSAQLTATNGWCLRRLDWWISVAVTSLPVPLSPVISTVLSLLPMTRRNSNTARIRALCPTTMPSMIRGAGVITASHQPQRLEFRDLVAQRGLDAKVQGHVRARAAGAHAGQLDAGGVLGHVDQFDVAAIGLQERTHPRQDRFDPLSGDHKDPPFRRPAAEGRATDVPKGGAEIAPVLR